jgi:hypothetical protein
MSVAVSTHPVVHIVCGAMHVAVASGREVSIDTTSGRDGRTGGEHAVSDVSAESAASAPKSRSIVDRWFMASPT